MRTLCRVQVTAVGAAIVLWQLAPFSQTSPTASTGASPSQRQAPPPTFRSQVQIVEIDVRVTDRDGRIVRDLSEGDFEILEDGVRQEIRSVTFVDLPVDRLAAPPRGVQVSESDVTTNTTPEGRTYVVLLDAGVGLIGRRIVRQFVDEWIAPGDQVGVVHVHGTFSDAQAFTTNKRLVLEAIEREGRGISGTGGGLTGPEMVTRELGTYRVVEDLAQRLGLINGRRKAILWIGGGIRFDPLTAPCPADDGRADPRNMCAIKRSAGNLIAAYNDAVSAATRHNVSIYPVDPARLTTSLGESELKRVAALRMMAEDTGGIPVVGTNNVRPLYEAIVRDNSTYYLLAYSPAVEHRDGRFHDVQVRVRRPEVNVRARRGYLAPRPVAVAAPAPLPTGFSEAARDALRMPIPVRGLAIQVNAAPFRSLETGNSVVVTGQVAAAREAASVGVSYQVFDLEGNVTTGEYKTFVLKPESKPGVRVERSGMRFVDRIQLPAGRYELRLAVDQPHGEVGSVVVPLEIPAFDEALSMSGILLAAASTAGDLTLHADAAVQAALGVAPTAIRRFPANERLSAYAEVYSNDRRTTAETVAMSASVATLTGEEVTRQSGRLVPEHTGRAGAWGFTTEVSLADVPPGDYTLTLEARSTRGNRRAVRRIPFQIRD